SAVAVGADPAAGFRERSPLHDCVLHRPDAPPLTGANPMTDEMQTPAARDAGQTAETEETTTVTDPTERASETRAHANPQQPAQPERSTAARAEDTEVLLTRARDAERDRVSTIYDLAGRLDLERGFAEDLVKRGVAIDEARRLILDQVAARSEETRTFPHVTVPLGGRDERVTRRDAVANALLHRFDPNRYELTDPAREWRGMSLIEMARALLEGEGTRVRGLSRDELAS